MGFADPRGAGRRFARETGRLGRRPDFEAMSVEARGRGERLEAEMLVRRHIITRGERARAFDGRFVIAAPPAFVALAAGERLFEQAAHVRRAAQAREDRVGGLHRLLGLPPALGSDGDPVVARGDMTDAREMPGCIAREVCQAASGRCNAHAGEQHSGQPHIRCEAPASGGLGGSVEPFEGLADQAALGGLAERWPRRRAAAGGFFGKLAEGEGAAGVEDEAVARLAFVRARRSSGRQPRRPASPAPPPPPAAPAPQTRAPRLSRR